MVPSWAGGHCLDGVRLMGLCHMCQAISRVHFRFRDFPVAKRPAKAQEGTRAAGQEGVVLDAFVAQEDGGHGDSDRASLLGSPSKYLWWDTLFTLPAYLSDAAKPAQTSPVALSVKTCSASKH